jgi:hypothetical protein
MLPTDFFSCVYSTFIVKNQLGVLQLDTVLCKWPLAQRNTVAIKKRALLTQPVIGRAEFISRRAEEKIKGIGGPSGLKSHRGGFVKL